MKKILVVFCAAVMAVSCLNDDIQNSVQYNMVATFEYVNDFEMKDLFGSDSLYFDTAYGIGLGWNDVAFCHKLDEERKNFKGGFILSYLKGKVYSEGDEPVKESDLFRVNAPADSSRTYSVFVESGVKEMMPEHDVVFMADTYGSCAVAGCFVNIPVYVAYAAAKEFKDGDVLKLTATGYRDDKVTSEKSIDLITCEGGELKMMTMWTKFDLSALGDVSHVDFDIESTNENVPEVFCMDNFVAKVSITY